MITNNYDELTAKDETIKKLMIAHSSEKNRADRAEESIAEYKLRCLNAEQEVKPLRDSINALSAEKSNLLRKIKRMENKK